MGEQRVAVYYNRRGLIVSSTSWCTHTCALCQHLWCTVYHHCRLDAPCGVWFYVHGSNSTHNCLHIEPASLVCVTGNHSLHSTLLSVPCGKLGLSKQAKVIISTHIQVINGYCLSTPAGPLRHYALQLILLKQT